MGMLIDGNWRANAIRPTQAARAEGFRGCIVTGGTIDREAEAGRYHLYVSYA
jgi:glutathionyl-hydroquinone reductase